MVADNEIRHLAERDDRALTELLKELAEADGLLGSGYDEMMLASLALVTRTAEEMPDLGAAADWAGLPEYDLTGDGRSTIIVNFRNDADREQFCATLGLNSDDIPRDNHGKSIWYPQRPYDDSRSILFVEGAEE